MAYTKILALLAVFGSAFVANCDGADLASRPYFRWDYKYSEITKMFYKKHTSTLNWLEALLTCFEEGASLAVPKTAVEYRELVSQAGPGTTFWIGITDLIQEGNFYGIDGKTLSNLYVEWSNSQPDNWFNEDCLEIRDDGKTNDQNCFNGRNFMCVKQPDVPLPIPPCNCRSPPLPFFRPDYKFVKSTSAFYKKHPLELPWIEAVVTCLQEGATLAAPWTETASREILVQAGFPAVTWIGVSDVRQEGRYEAVDGSTANNFYLNFAPPQPDNFQNKEDCLQLWANGNANDLPCDEKHFFVCSKNYVPPVITPDCQCCCKSKSVSYTYKSVPATWSEALNVCMAEGGSLATPESAAENAVVTNLIGNNQKSIWIGAHDMFAEGKFLRVDGDNRLRFINWMSGEPNNLSGSEHCVRINRNGTAVDVPCNLKYEYVCAKRPTPCPGN